MSDLPEPVLRALRAHTTEPPLAALRTAGQHPVGELGAATVLLPMWCVLTTDRAWVIAADEQHATTWAAGDLHAVTLDRGWLTDTLHVAQHELPLRAGSRKAAAALIELWTAAEKHGAAVAPEPTPPAPPDRTRSAAAAVGLPDWWSAAVPAPAGSRWLFALETASTYAFARANGQPHVVSVWIGFTDQHIALAAWDAEHREVRWRELTRSLSVATGATRPWLDAGDVQLGAPRLEASSRKLAVDLSEADPENRWSLLAEHHLDQSDPRAAISTWEEALALDRARRCWPGIARLAWAAVDTPRAHRALTFALVDGTTRAGDRSEWAAPLRWRARAVPNPQEIGALIADLLGGAIAALSVPDRAPQFPDPAATEIELWVGALAAARRWSQADDAARALPDDGRGREVLAALRTTQSHPTAPLCWQQAAVAWRSRQHPTAARRCLERSLDLAFTPAAAWLSAAWASEDGELARRDLRLAAAIAADPDGLFVEDPQLSLDAALAAARFAHDAGHHRLTARLLRRVITLDPTRAGPRWQLAELLAGPLDRRSEAIEALRELAVARDEGMITDDRHPGAAWLRVAELAPEEQVAEALQQAASRDFLRAAALRDDAEHADTSGLPAKAAAWRRLAALLDPPGEVLPPPSPTALTAQDLHTTHPSVTDWLEKLRLALDPQPPPPRHEIVRGLGSLAEAAPEAQALLEATCAQIGLPVVEAFVYRGDRAWGASAWPCDPPVLLLGHAHLSLGPRQLDEAQLRFLLAVELAHLRCGHPLISSNDGLVGTSRSLYAAFGRFAGPAESAVAVLTLLPGLDQLSRLERAITVSQRVFQAHNTAEKVGHATSPLWAWLSPQRAPGAVGREDLRGNALQLRMHADRVAILLTRDPRAAVLAILRASTTALPYAERVEREGLAAVLSDPNDPLPADQALRISALLSFAAARG
jgi:tetratricopeptide (TPR) repeat protein